MTPPPGGQQIFSHIRLQSGPSRWRIGYLAEPATEPGMIRVSYPVAAQMSADMQALRAQTLAETAQATQFYEDAIGEVDAHLPRVEMHGDYLIVDWRHIAGDSDAFRVTHRDPDGRYTIGRDLAWQQVDADRCDTVRDDTTWPPPVLTAYQSYVGFFTDATAAMLHLVEQAGIAVAWLDRSAIEAGSRPLSDHEWNAVREQLYRYDEHVSAVAEINSVFLEHIFGAAGVEHRTGGAGNATA